MSPGQHRATYLLAALVNIGIGLLVHWKGASLGRGLQDVLGDALWAMMMVWWISLILPRVHLLTRCSIAYVICLAVEGSQLIRTPALDALRETRAGHLILGTGFDPRDLLAYAAGVVSAACLDAGLRHVYRRER